MKGGFNKILRNIVAGSADTEFEKASMTLIPSSKQKANNFLILVETHESNFPSGFQRTKREACYL